MSKGYTPHFEMIHYHGVLLFVVHSPKAITIEQVILIRTATRAFPCQRESLKETEVCKRVFDPDLSHNFHLPQTLFGAAVLTMKTCS